MLEITELVRVELSVVTGVTDGFTDALEKKESVKRLLSDPLLLTDTDLLTEELGDEEPTAVLELLREVEPVPTIESELDGVLDSTPLTE